MDPASTAASISPIGSKSASTFSPFFEELVSDDWKSLVASLLVVAGESAAADVTVVAVVVMSHYFLIAYCNYYFKSF